MSQPANVRSISALADFRAALVMFAETAKRVLDEVDMEIGRAVEWISGQQPAFWKSETQRSWDLVAQRRNELEQCERKSLDGQRPSCYDERKALEAAKRYVRYVEEKIETVRRWGRRVQQEVSEYEGQLARFRFLLEGEVPKSLALLERMILTLEAYAEIPVVPAAGIKGQAERQSVARETDDEEDKVETSVFHQLREHTPSHKMRRRLKVKRQGGEAKPAEPAGQEGAADEATCEQAALATAYDLQLEPALPGWQEKVVLLAGCLEQEQVYVERIEAGQRDSGWFIGPVEPNLGVEPEYQAFEMRELIELCPTLLLAFALPAGYLAVFSNEELVAVVNEAGIDLWRPAVEGKEDVGTSGAEEKGKTTDGTDGHG